MIVVGLTGSIGMGKSTTATMFAEEGVPVYDADAAVHALYAKDGAAVDPIGQLAPEAIVEGAVDRDVLRKAVFEDDTLLQRIELAVHPLLKNSRRDFFTAHLKAPIVVLDIPLLFETAPPEVQRERVLARPDMTPERFEAILAKQTPDAEKRERADYVIDTSKGLDAARMSVHVILQMLREEAGV